MRLAEFGATARGGVSRLALSDEEVAARAELVRWGGEIGLRAFVDDAANLFLSLEGTSPDLPPVLMGSHIDTQPTGGKFDGAYGVVAGVEALHAIAQSGRRPLRSIVVVAWMNEEGSRFAPGMMGSEAFAGVRSLDAIRATRDAAGVAVAEALDALHAAFPELHRRPLGFPLAAYIEAHIEQGPVLEAEGRVIGVVTGIQGKKTFDVVLQGDRGHAGTLAMADRRDALAAFARKIGRAHV